MHRLVIGKGLTQGIHHQFQKGEKIVRGCAINGSLAGDRQIGFRCMNA